jgi:hypothetical protein
MGKYYLRLLEYTFSLSWHSTDRIATAIGLIVPPLARVFGLSEGTVNSWLWEIPLLGFFAALALRAVVAPYAIHRQGAEVTESIAKERDRLQSELNLERPELSGKIDEIIFGQSGDAIGIQLLVSIRNSGEPSIAEHWEVYVHLSDGQRIRASLWGDPVTLYAGGGAGNIVIPGQQNPQVIREIREEDFLHNKTAKAIQKGELARGYLSTKFSSISHDDLTHKDALFVVRFQDVTGRQYECNYRFNDDPPMPLGKGLRYAGDSSPQRTS